MSKITEAVARKTFGKDIKVDIIPTHPKFMVVSLGEVEDEVHTQRVIMCDPTTFFDEACPHCKPFFDDGAFMVYTNNDLMGVRVSLDGMFESVMLTKQEGE